MKALGSSTAKRLRGRSPTSTGAGSDVRASATRRPRGRRRGSPARGAGGRAGVRGSAVPGHELRRERGRTRDARGELARAGVRRRSGDAARPAHHRRCRARRPGDDPRRGLRPALRRAAPRAAGCRRPGAGPAAGDLLAQLRRPVDRAAVRGRRAAGPDLHGGGRRGPGRRRAGRGRAARAVYERRRARRSSRPRRPRPALRGRPDAVPRPDGRRARRRALPHALAGAGGRRRAAPDPGRAARSGHRAVAAMGAVGRRGAFPALPARFGRMTRRVLLSILLLLAAPASAHAATLTNAGGTLTYVAGAGKDNDVAFSQAPASVTVTASDSDPITATGCTGTNPVLTCPGVVKIVAGGGDRDDDLDASLLTTTGAALDGGAGDDRLQGGDGADSIRGGDGIDRVTAVGDPVSVSLNDIADDDTDNIHADVEDVDATTAGTATLAGSDASNVISAGTGPATITGGGGSDTLNGGAAADTIDARDGYADRVTCNAGVDTVKADQLDQVASDCETVTREPFVGGADDRPPAVTWTAPAAGTSISADRPTTLTAGAADDRGVAKVQFLDDDRLVCEDTIAPYTCEYAPRGGDVGRDTLIARAVDTADQASSAIQAVTVRRFSARRLTLKLNPARDTRAPFRFQVTGNLTLPPAVARTQGCQGSEVSIMVRAGGKIVATRRLTLSRVCGYQRRIDFSRRPGTRLRFTARFLGNDVMQPISAPSRTGRTA